MEGVAEFQGFKDNNNRFIVKEFALVGPLFSNGAYQTQVIFKPPYNFNLLNSKMRRTARWLARSFHYIKWDEGGVEYNEELIRDLCKPFKVIHTKGREKAEFLREFHPTVFEIDENLNVYGSCLEVDCLLVQHEKHDENCALRSAVYYSTCLE